MSSDLSAKLRRAADAIEKRDRALEWAPNMPLAGIRCAVRWEEGAGLLGYKDVSEEVSRMVSETLPDLIGKARANLALDAQRALDAARNDD